MIKIEADASGHVSLEAMLRDLAARGINDVHSECGQRLAGALLRQGLVDRVVLYLAPHLLGSEARGLFDLGEFTDMDQRINCSVSEIRQVGDDIRLSLGINPE